MLPDYPEIKTKLEKEFNLALRKEINKDPFISQIPVRRIYEGDKMDTITEDGFKDSREYVDTRIDFTLEPNEYIEKGYFALSLKIPELARGFAQHQSKIIIDHMNEVTEKTGHVINGKNKSLIEVYLESLLSVSIIFDELGNPNIPSLIIPPNDLKKWREAFSKLETNPDLRKLRDLIIWLKWREWIDRENNRKLVD
jgi:hypothetical protein